MRHDSNVDCNYSIIITIMHLTMTHSQSLAQTHYQISDDGIEILTEHGKNLRALDLSWCNKITDVSLECIACDLSANLRELILDR